MKKFEVWNRGFSKQFNCPWSTFICLIKGENFNAAFKEHMKEKDWPYWTYNAEEKTLLGDPLVIIEI